MTDVIDFGDTSCVAATKHPQYSVVMKKDITWAEMKFPPINLWVLAGSPVLSDRLENTRNHRLQRPGMKDNHANSLRYFGREQIQKILAMHGGK